LLPLDRFGSNQDHWFAVAGNCGQIAKGFIAAGCDRRKRRQFAIKATRQPLHAGAGQLARC
jgi:hypothetical protein